MMRPKTKNMFPEFFSLETESTTEPEKANTNVQHYRNLYKTLDEYLKKYPEIAIADRVSCYHYGH